MAFFFSSCRIIRDVFFFLPLRLLQLLLFTFYFLRVCVSVFFFKTFYNSASALFASFKSSRTSLLSFFSLIFNFFVFFVFSFSALQGILLCFFFAKCFRQHWFFPFNSAPDQLDDKILFIPPRNCRSCFISVQEVSPRKFSLFFFFN